MTRNLTARLTVPDHRGTAGGLPGCVAQPPEQVPYRGRLVPRTQLYPDPYRGWDHRNCTHPSPLPEGTRRCAGDPGCEVRLPARGHRHLCPVHEDQIWSLPSDRQYDAMLGMWQNQG